jgi:DNA replication protein DnaC
MDTSSKGTRAQTSCPLCKGSGFLHPRLPSGATDFARVVPCQCQAELLKKERQSSLERFSNLASLSHMTFETFDTRRVSLTAEQRDNLEKAFNLARNFAREPDGWLVFQGMNGCGKTHLAAAIGNYQLKQGKPVLFLSVADLLDHLRSTFSPESSVSYDELFERVRNTPLLILDDLGEHSATPWAREKLYQIVNHRYNAKLPTVITTCLSLEEIEDRISSRLSDTWLSSPWNITAPDYRSDRRPVRGKKPAPRFERQPE